MGWNSTQICGPYRPVPLTIKPLHSILYIPSQGMIWLNLGQYPRPQTGNTSLLFCTNTNTLSESIIRDYDLGSKNAYVIWRIIQEARLTEWPPESTEKGKSAHWRRKWQPTPVFLPGESQDGGAWWAAVCGAAQSRTRLKRLSSSSSRG